MPQGPTSARLIRTDDLVVLDAHWTGMSVANQTLAVDAGQANGRLVVELPPQHVLEQAFFLARKKLPVRKRPPLQKEETPTPYPVTPGTPPPPDDPDLTTEAGSTPVEPPSGDVWSRIAGPTRLVFQVPAGMTIPLNAAGFLQSLSSLRPSLAPNAWAGSAAGAEVDSPALDSPARLRRRLTWRAVARRRSTQPPASSPPGSAIGLPSEPSFHFAPKPTPPDPERHTAIELPYRLLLSPHEHSAWFHRPEPFQGATGRTELWHTRLGVWLLPWRDPSEPRIDGAHELKTVRAIWTRDGAMDTPPLGEFIDAGPRVHEPFRASLDSFDRRNIVHLSSNFGLGSKATPDDPIEPYTPVPIDIELLMLSSLGGWLDSRGVWDFPQPRGLSVQEWRHRATMGRDHYVRVVYEGRLFGLGHRASVVKVTERLFHGKAGRAYLRQSMCVVPRERVRTYRSDQPLLDAFPEVRRNFPFRAVRITTLVSPNIDDPVNSSPIAGLESKVFWPMVGEKPFRFHCEALDAAGQLVDFTIPLLFVDKSVTDRDLDTQAGNDIRDVSEYYNKETTTRRTVDLVGQSVAYAEPGPGSPAEAQVSHSTTSLTLSSFVPEKSIHDSMSWQDARFFPVMESASLAVPALQAFADAGAMKDVRYWGPFLEKEWVDNAGEIFLEVHGEARVLFSDKADRCGALATPDLSIIGLSRKIGPVSGAASGGSPDQAQLGALAKDEFNAKDFFGSMAGAKLLGSLSLGEIVKEGNLTEAPQFLSVDGVRRLQWKAPLQNIPGVFTTKGEPLEVIVESKEVTDTPSTAAAVTMKTTALLKKFSLDLAGVLRLNFESLLFKVEAGRKPEIDVAFTDVEFLGALQFVETLRTLIPADGFSDPPAVEVNPSGITAGYSLALPPVAVGVFSLQSITLGAGFSVPFLGPPMHAWFNFATRDDPALLTVGPFGGAAFFGVRVHPAGLLSLEASLEFGAGIAMNFGVAAGSVTVMGGVYFEYRDDGTAGLTGFFRARGVVKALGIVSVSIELYLGLEPWVDVNNPKALKGDAHIWIEVDLGLIEKDIKISASKKFGGASADPTFGEMMHTKDWERYWAAFAT